MNDDDERQPGAGGDLTRREAMKLGAAAALTASLGVAGSLAAQGPAVPAPAFFTSAELALLDELSEMIIPADGHSPGARAAKVAAYLDSRLAEAFDPKERETWREGLRIVEAISREGNGKTFVQASAEERLAVLTRMAHNENKPESPEQLFFAELKSGVVHAYYTSEIGIKQEMEYKGNTYLAEFVGHDVS